MITEFFQTDLKLFIAWVGSGIMVILNKSDINFFEKHELLKTVILDVLTGALLIITIGYTIARWIKLRKDRSK